MDLLRWVGTKSGFSPHSAVCGLLIGPLHNSVRVTRDKCNPPEKSIVDPCWPCASLPCISMQCGGLCCCVVWIGESDRSESECSWSDSKLAGTFNIDYRHGARPREAPRGTRRFARAFAGWFLAGEAAFFFLAIAIFLRLHGCSWSVGLTGPCSVYGKR